MGNFLFKKILSTKTFFTRKKIFFLQEKKIQEKKKTFFTRKKNSFHEKKKISRETKTFFTRKKNSQGK